MTGKKPAKGGIDLKNKKEKRSAPLNPKVEELIKIWSPRSDTANTDVLGSYTGTPESGDLKPVQDADDL